jgi:hypothetical protein
MPSLLMAEKDAQKAPPAAAPEKKPGAAAQPPKTIADVLQSTQIALDTYDDIFSDFDSSPFTTRVLSDDFLQELRKRYAETQKGDLMVNFTLPQSLRSEKTEALIRKRLKDYFKIQLAQANRNIRRVRFRGLMRVGAGILALMPLAFFPNSILPPISMLLSVLSWYFLWSGFDSLLELPTKMMGERSFFEKFVKAKYNFVPEEQIARSIGNSSYR